MKKVWHDNAWEEYLYWQVQDKKINALVQDIERNGANDGIGKPEPLKGDFSGYYSRRIDDANRLVYAVKDGVLEIVACKSHYGDH